MSITEEERPVIDAATTYALIEELRERGELYRAAREFRQETRRAPWRRLRISESIYGLSSRWLCICPWNGDTSWITLPFIYSGVGTKNIELRVGSWKYGVTFDIRWRWD